MKPGAINHPKVKRLSRRLVKAGVPEWLSENCAIGILERLYHFTASYPKQGDIGRFDDEDLADALCWSEEPAFLIEALREAGYVDEHSEHRLVVHDWPEHAPDAVHMALYRAGLYFFDGSKPRARRLSREERASADEIYAAKEGQGSAESAPGADEIPAARTAGTQCAHGRYMAGRPPSPSLPSPSLEEGEAPSGAARAPRSPPPQEAFDRVDPLYAAIRESVPGQAVPRTSKQFEAAARELDLLHRLGPPGGKEGDGYGWAEIDAVIRWLPTHRGSGDFTWGKNILSATKLRKHFPRLLAEMRMSSGSRRAGNVDMGFWEGQRAEAAK